MKRFLPVLAILSGFAALSSAASLNLHYTVTPSGSLFNYNMTLSVDTSGSAWSPGMGWSWITFGDVPSPGPSNLADFVLTSAPPAPFTSMTFSSGGHNGPTFLTNGSGIVYWTPTSASDTISWSGTSANPGLAGTLQFSELLTQGDATADSWKNMILDPVPEPATLLVLGGLLPAVIRKRRK